MWNELWTIQNVPLSAPLVFEVIDGREDVFRLLLHGSTGKPDRQTTRSTSAFFVDFVFKHALHANCAQAVRYSGDFHPRPAGGWASFTDNMRDDAGSS